MNNYFCVLPFYSQEINGLSSKSTPCCLLPIDADLNTLKQEMLNGQRPSACQKCWDIEDQGRKSDRQIKNEAFDYYANKDIITIEEECQQGHHSTQIVKLYTSNLCNSTCVTCGSSASSAWATLRKQKTFQIISNDALDPIDYKNLKMLSFVGGEPLLEKKNFYVLEKLLEHNNSDCFISFVTNSSVSLNDNQKNILSKFKKVNICLSIDGIESRFEYMRYPLGWNLLLENLEFFRSLNFNISASYVISNINAIYYQETIDWFKKEKILHNHIVVSYPSYFSPQHLPFEIKKKLNNPLIPQVTNELDNVKFDEAIQELKTQDYLKKINIKDYMPEFFEIIQEKYLSN